MGVAIGCGGCLTLVMLAFGVVLAIGFIVLTVMRSSAPCNFAFQAAQSSEVLIREIGEPMKKGYLITGNFNAVNSSGLVCLLVVQPIRPSSSFCSSGAALLGRVYIFG